MDELVSLSQFCFQLEDMQDITPFWEWIERRIRFEKIYTEPEDFEAIMKGFKKLDNNKYLIIDEPYRASDTLCSIRSSYNGQTFEIIGIIAQRLSDHRFKVEVSFWEPVGWPKSYLWNIFNNFLKDLSHDYPDAKKSLQNSILGFKYEELDEKQKKELFGKFEDSTHIEKILQKKRPRGRPSNEGYDAAFKYMIKNKKNVNEAYEWWEENYPLEASFSFNSDNKKRFAKAMTYRKDNPKT